MKRFVLALAVLGMASTGVFTSVVRAAELDSTTSRQTFVDEKGRSHALWATDANRPSFVASRLATIQTPASTLSAAPVSAPAMSHHPMMTMTEQCCDVAAPKDQPKAAKRTTQPARDSKNHLIER